MELNIIFKGGFKVFGEIIFNPLSISPILTVVSPDPAGPGDGLHLDGLVELLGHGVAHSRAETGDH